MAKSFFGDAGEVSTAGAVGDYAGNAGNNHRGGMQFWRPGANGVIITAEMFDNNPGDELDWQSEVSFQSATDGLSKTFLAGEKQIPALAGERQGSLYNGDNQNNCARVAGRVAPIANGEHDLTRCRDASGCNGRGSGRCICDTFGSPHPGVCQFVFLDGHVVAIKNTIDLRVVDNLAARADGAAISADF